MGALHLGRQTLFFLKKKTGDLFSHHRPCIRCQFSSKTGDLFLLISHHTRSLGARPLFPVCKKIPLLLWGPLFGRACWTCLNSPLNTIQPNPGNPVPTTGYPVPKPGNKSTHYLIRSRLIVGSALDMLSVFVLDRCLQVGETSSFHRNLHQFFAAKLFWTMSADICLFVDGVSRVTWICLSTSRLGRINHSLQFRHHAAMLRHLQQHVVAPSGNAVIQKCERKMVRNIKLQFH